MQCEVEINVDEFTRRFLRGATVPQGILSHVPEIDYPLWKQKLGHMYTSALRDELCGELVSPFLFPVLSCPQPNSDTVDSRSAK